MEIFEEITDFIYNFKNKNLEANEIINLKNSFATFEKKIKESEYYSLYYENYLNITGYTFRLEDKSQRVFYTFQEAIYAIDLAKLMRDEESKKLNSIVYALVINDCINNYFDIQMDETFKNEAIEFYKKEQARVSKENAKYHMYQN